MEDETSKLREFLAAQGIEETPEIMEALSTATEYVNRMTGTTKVQYGAGGWTKFVQYTWPRWRHRLGIHQHIPSYGSEGGGIKYLGLRCWICGHSTGA